MMVIKITNINKNKRNKNKKIFNKFIFIFFVIFLSIIIYENDGMSETILSFSNEFNKNKYEIETFKEITDQEKEEIIDIFKEHLKKKLGEEQYNKFIQKNKLDKSTIVINKKIERKKIENIPNNNNNNNNNNENSKFFDKKIENEKIKNLNNFYNIEKIIDFADEFKIFYFKYKPNNKIKIGIQKNNYLYFNNNLYLISSDNNNLFFSLITTNKNNNDNNDDNNNDKNNNKNKKLFDKNLIQTKKELIEQMDTFIGYEIIKKINNNNSDDNDNLKINYTFHFSNQNILNRNNQDQVLILVLNISCSFSIRKFLEIKEILLEISNTSNNSSIRDIYIYTLETITDIKYYNKLNNNYDKSMYLMQCINKNNKEISYNEKIKLLIEYFNNKKLKDDSINDCDNIKEIQNKYVENAFFYTTMDINKVPILFLYNINEKKIKKHINNIKEHNIFKK